MPTGVGVGTLIHVLDILSRHERRAPYEETIQNLSIAVQAGATTPGIPRTPFVSAPQRPDAMPRRFFDLPNNLLTSTLTPPFPSPPDMSVVRGVARADSWLVVNLQTSTLAVVTQPPFVPIDLFFTRIPYRSRIEFPPSLQTTTLPAETVHPFKPPDIFSPGPRPAPPRDVVFYIPNLKLTTLAPVQNPFPPMDFGFVRPFQRIEVPIPPNLSPIFLTPKKAQKPFLPRIPDVHDPNFSDRMRRFSEILSASFNALVQAGYVVQLGANTYIIRAGAFSAPRAPTMEDDVRTGVLVGSSWVNTATGKIYFCVSNTMGLAVWNGPY